MQKRITPKGSASLVPSQLLPGESVVPDIFSLFLYAMVPGIVMILAGLWAVSRPPNEKWRSAIIGQRRSVRQRHCLWRGCITVSGNRRAPY